MKKLKTKVSNGGPAFSWSQLKAIGAGIVALSIIIGTAFAVDTRYASAESVKKLRVDIELVSAHQRKATVEDKLFELQQRPVRQRTSRDDALIQRYQRELDEVQQKIRDLENKK